VDSQLLRTPTNFRLACLIRLVGIEQFSIYFGCQHSATDKRLSLGLVGCGAWSAPLLAAALWLTQTHTHAWVVAFYGLALAFNYPHFMATVYRAYHTRADFEKYKIFTLHITLLLILTGVLLHASYRLFPWVFTLYILWSPWHYTGQNYGLLMMFARRSGAHASSCGLGRQPDGRIRFASRQGVSGSSRSGAPR